MSSALPDTATPGPDTPGTHPSRRAILGGAVGVAAAVGASTVLGTSSAAAAAAPTGAAFMTTSAERHLISRATYGANAASLAAIHKMGTTKWLEWQLNPSAIKDTVADSLLKRLPIPSDATPIWKVNYLLDTDQVGGYEQLISIPTAHMIRAIWSQRQVLTVMEELWSDLFNVTVPHDGTAESRAHYQYTIRRNSLGKFSDLLWAITHHPAMLTYLNNRDSTRQAPNENQGRELLELHSVGVNAGYTEKDVLNSARILSGLTQVSTSTGRGSTGPAR